MPLTSASTLAEVEAEYRSNADYDDGAGDITKARAYRTAIRYLLQMYPSQFGSDQTQVSRNLEMFDRELKRVQSWLDANDSAVSGSHVSVLDFREARR